MSRGLGGHMQRPDKASAAKARCLGRLATQVAAVTFVHAGQ